MKKINSAFDITQSILSGKWKAIILYHLEQDNKRTKDLLKICSGISHKVLSEQLSQLTDDGLIIRTVYTNKKLIMVEYSITEYGITFIPLIKEMCRVGEEHIKIKGNPFSIEGSCSFKYDPSIK